MSTESTDENSYFKVDKSLKELKPLHHTKPFWAIIAATLFLPAMTAHLIYPLNLFNLIVLENGSELYRTSLVVGGACVTILTIYSLAYRSMETNRQIRISTIQYRLAAMDPARKRNEELVLELHSLLIHIMRIQDRLKYMTSMFETYKKLFDGPQAISPDGLESAKNNIMSNIGEIKDLTNKLYDKHQAAIASIARPHYDTLSIFDGNVVNLMSVSMHISSASEANIRSVINTAIESFDNDFANQLEEKAREIEKEAQERHKTFKLEWI